jgi:hypothetical protein
MGIEARGFEQERRSIDDHVSAVPSLFQTTTLVSPTHLDTLYTAAPRLAITAYNFEGGIYTPLPHATTTSPGVPLSDRFRDPPLVERFQDNLPVFCFDDTNHGVGRIGLWSGLVIDCLASEQVLPRQTGSVWVNHHSYRVTHHESRTTTIRHDGPIASIIKSHDDPLPRYIITQHGNGSDTTTPLIRQHRERPCLYSSDRQQSST